MLMAEWGTRRANLEDSVTMGSGPRLQTSDHRAEAPGATPDRPQPAVLGRMRSFHWMWLGFLKEVGGDVLRDLWGRRNNQRTRGTWLGFGIVLARMVATIASL